MRRREFITLVGGTAAAWPLVARAQQPALPVVAFVRDGSPEGNVRYVAAFRKGLNESGYVEGQNVTVEYHWIEGQYDRLPALLADPAVQMSAYDAKRACAGVAPDPFQHASLPVRWFVLRKRHCGGASSLNFLAGRRQCGRLRRGRSNPQYL